MGMDVFGKKPKNKSGEYFRNNVWYWHPLWDFCSQIAPEITAKVPDAHSNSGDGLNAGDSIKLATRLKNAIKSGIAVSYIEKFNELKNSANATECYCISAKLKVLKSSACFICKGTGLMEDPIKSYSINKENILNFILFLENCGGFEIC